MRTSDLFADSWSPTKISFWLQPNHWTALAEGMGADEAEALRYEWLLVSAGQRSLLGRPCLCGTVVERKVNGKVVEHTLQDGVEDWPGAVRGGMSGAHDSVGSMVSLRTDLEGALDQLPLRWRETHRCFVVQGRGELWRVRVGLCNTGQRWRREDLMADLGRQHAWAWMAWSLGWRGRCTWPRLEQPVLKRAA